MGRIAIFTDDPGWHGARLRQAFASRGYGSEYLSLTQCRLALECGEPPVLIPGFEGGLPDGVFVRGVPGGSLEEVVFYLDILHALKILGIPVYNDGRAIERSVDKAMTSFLLMRAGIPTPPTWVLRDRELALRIAEKELRGGHEIVAKPLFGSQGEGLQRLTTLADLLQLCASNGIYYLQRFISSGDEYRDWRVFVINGEAVAAMCRFGDGWLNNVAQGGRCEVAALDEHCKQLAEAAVAAVGMDYGGVDIIRDPGGRDFVIEVNSIPAWKGLQSVIDKDIAELLAEDFLGRCGGAGISASCA